ncbi:hypothetical protein ABPG77_009933 [Micractinium sp. CCAP 211/92]
MKAVAVILALLVAAATVQADTPPPGTNCHRSCYTLDLAKALPLKQSYFKSCNAATKVTIQKTMRGNPKSPDRSIKNAYGCGAVIQYKFKSYSDLLKYQNCEHGLKAYISQLQPYKKSLPAGVLRDFKC